MQSFFLFTAYRWSMIVGVRNGTSAKYFWLHSIKRHGQNHNFCYLNDLSWCKCIIIVIIVFRKIKFIRQFSHIYRTIGCSKIFNLYWFALFATNIAIDPFRNLDPLRNANIILYGIWDMFAVSQPAKDRNEIIILMIFRMNTHSYVYCFAAQFESNQFSQIMNIIDNDDHFFVKYKYNKQWIEDLFEPLHWNT